MGFFKRGKGSPSSMNGTLDDTENGQTGEYMPIADSAGNSMKSVNSPDLRSFMHVTVYFLMGAGFLFPWHGFITAVDYFDYLYPNSHIDRVFTIAYLIPCLIALIILVPYGERFSVKWRINVGLVMFFFCIVVVPFMDEVFINGNQGSLTTYTITVSAVAISGIADGIVQGTLIGSAADLPHRYTQAIVSGTGFSGLLVCLLRIVTKASLPQTVSGLRKSANIYFAVGAFFLILCVVSYNLIPKPGVPNYSSYYSSHEPAISSAVADYSSLTENGSGLDVENHHGDGLDSFDSKASIGNHSSQTLHPSVDSSPTVLGECASERKDVRFRETALKEVFIQVKWVAAAIGLTFALTLIIFPGFLTEDVESATLGDWYGILLVTTFNVFDLIGKTSSVLCVPRNEVSSIVGSLLRVLLIPLFAVCVHGPTFLRTEFPIFFLTSLLGYTHGLLTASFFVVTPKLVHPADAQTAGIVMVLALQAGLTIGSFCSWFWVV